MHKQLLSTAFAAFLALALTLCVLDPMAESGEAEQTSEEITTEEYTETTETVPEETLHEPPETTEEVTETEKEEVTAEPEEEICLPSLPEGAEPLSLYINGRAIEDGFCFGYEGRIWLPVKGF
ncbi:MAG: hypothetical protein IKJ04_03205, partial [Clostridia bacterium]|nr:hypothetical protein [Clostridia bacterium]